MENFKKYIEEKGNGASKEQSGFVKLEGDYNSGKCKNEYVYHYGRRRMFFPEMKEDGSGEVNMPHEIYEYADIDKVRPFPNEIVNETKLSDRDVVRVIDFMIKCDIGQTVGGRGSCVNKNKKSHWYYDDHIVYYSFYTQEGKIMLCSVCYDPQGKGGYHEQRRYDF